MDTISPAKAGRPRGSSRDMLQEAAAELFLEQTYARTTIEQVTQRAGVSRNTFFNYFRVKSDLLWVEFDEELACLPELLESSARHAGSSGSRGALSGAHATEAVRLALVELASAFGPARVPWALTQAELMGTTGELEASALSRFSASAGLLSGFVAGRTGRSADDMLCRAFAMAVLAAAAAAAITWAAAGVKRGGLAHYVYAAITPVCDGYRAALQFG